MELLVRVVPGVRYSTVSPDTCPLHTALALHACVPGVRTFADRPLTLCQHQHPLQVDEAKIICQSFPTYGTDRTNPPGNEYGYLTGMSVCKQLYTTPFPLNEGDHVHIRR